MILYLEGSEDMLKNMPDEHQTVRTDVITKSSGSVFSMRRGSYSLKSHIAETI